jgi:ACS family glucarate transporter-like MFS transporter
VNIAVAQQYIALEFHFNDIQIGYIFSAFLIGYTLFQIPSGILADRFGPRSVFVLSGLWWAATTFLTGAVPAFGGTLLFLLVIRFLHGVGESAMYPVGMSAISRWFPVSTHALITALVYTGSTVGSACAPPLVAGIMHASGWRATFYWTALPPLLLTAFWLLGTRRILPVQQVIQRKLSPGVRITAWWRLLRSRDVAALCLSYFLYCYAISIYVYWLFKYLVDVRHLSIVSSGWVNAVPWIAASVAVPCFGWFSTRLARSIGSLPAQRNIAVACLLAAAFLMYVGASAQQIGAAVAAIAVSVALLFCTESPYGSTCIQISGEDAGTGTGLMNLAGNLGGIAATSLVPVLETHFGWLTALLSGSIAALLAAAVWFVVRKNSEGL